MSRKEWKRAPTRRCVPAQISGRMGLPDLVAGMEVAPRSSWSARAASEPAKTTPSVEGSAGPTVPVRFEGDRVVLCDRFAPALFVATGEWLDCAIKGAVGISSD